ncbi:MAG: UdgX family uracil-DNA binding protein [Candidatus Acidiferrales bacterium]
MPTRNPQRPLKKPRKKPPTTAKDPAQAKISATFALRELARLAQKCKACDLWKRATQAVFGEGRPDAKVMFVGEVPGDREDREGKPFVGPAGNLLDKALEEVGIDRSDVYVTNAVKHFNWEERGKRRVHKKPRASEIAACRPWLEAEIERLKPAVIVCLGATAAQALLGKDYRVTKHHGEFVESALAPHVTALVHPSAILHALDEASRHEEMKHFIDDLKKVAAAIRTA